MQSRSVSRILGSLLAVVSMLVCLLYTVWVVTDPNTLAIKHVTVEGSLEHLDKRVLEQLVSPHVTGGFFHIDAKKVQSVLIDLPWVDTVSVQRIWPDSLRVTVIEHLPVARWGRDALVNSKGQIFKARQLVDDSELPSFDGPRSQSALMVERYKLFSRMLTPLKLGIKRLSVSTREAWDLELSNGLLLRLGREDIPKRAQRFISSLPKLYRAGQPPRYADLRYTNGLAVSW